MKIARSRVRYGASGLPFRCQIQKHQIKQPGFDFLAGAGEITEIVFVDRLLVTLARAGESEDVSNGLRLIRDHAQSKQRLTDDADFLRLLKNLFSQAIRNLSKRRIRCRRLPELADHNARLRRRKPRNLKILYFLSPLRRR